MKKSMNNIFDEASASEIENLVKKNDAPDVSDDTLISIKNKVYAKTGIANSKKKRAFVFRWQSYIAVAACFALIVGAITVVPMLRAGDPSEVTPPSDESHASTESHTSEESNAPINDYTIISDHTPIIYDATASPEKLNGSSFEFVLGSSASISEGQMEEPPSFEFGTGDFVVKARVVNNRPELYYKLDVSSEYKPAAYRLIEMECVEVIHGKDIPEHFFYLIKNSMFVDMSVYDSLLISMSQIGTDNYVLRNDTEKRIEALSLPVFSELYDRPALGSIIAFSDGIVDESLWHNQGWRYGLFYLDYPQHADLVFKRGDSESDVISEIKRRIEQDKQWLGDRYRVPALVTLNCSTQAAKSALDYVKPFENGVFLQYLSGGNLTFTRFINGCQTEEWIKIDLVTEEVTYSEVRYTDEEMSGMENISAHLQKKAEEYAIQTPTPPHTDPEGKKLLCLYLYAWYAKVDGKVYGVVKTGWRHAEEDNMFIQYYDEEYVLYDMSDSTAKIVSRDYLRDLLGWRRNISNEEFGVGIDIPMCY